MDAVHSRLRIGRRFRGPPGAANGGFASCSPVPLERPLGVRHDGDATLLPGDDDRLLAEAHPSGPEVELAAPDTPTPEEARAAVAGSALLGPDGEVLAAVRALWGTAARTAGGSG